MPCPRLPAAAAGMAAVAACLAFLPPLPALAQSEVTVFAPFRGIATPVARAGSAVSVITREEIEQAGQVSVAELLRSVPSVSFTTSGGFGSDTDVRLRGGEGQHTMVLVDGVPVTDTTSTRNAADFTLLPAASIERIEVLRGPQSALYGSDAMAGVINIVTRQAASGLTGSARLEGGSFGTWRQEVEAAHGAQRFGIAGFASHVSTEGFTRREGNAERDGARQWSGGFRAHAAPSESVRLEAALQVTDLESDYDRRANDPAGLAERTGITGHARVRHEGFDGRWTHTLTAFAGSTDRRFTEPATVESYEGSRLGAELTGQVRFETAGTLLYGVTAERQEASLVTNGVRQFAGDEVLWGAFALHQVSVTPNLHLSGALRFDDFAGAGTFLTGRATAAYEIPATETRLHASIGSGAKAPSLRQRASTPGLLPEESWGFDAGVTQTLLDGRLTVDVTGFRQSYRNLHVYTGGFGSFALEAWANVARAEMSGVEVTADARLIPGQLEASASYTFLVAEDASTGLRLERRPEHAGSLTLAFTGIDRLHLSATAHWVGGERYSRSRERDPLDPYVRVDARASYRVHEHLEVFGRVENLFDVDYEEIDGYETPGLSAHAGVRASF